MRMETHCITIHVVRAILFEDSLCCTTLERKGSDQVFSSQLLLVRHGVAARVAVAQGAALARTRDTVLQGD